ncbi:MAG: SET domain-containing protein-lysine N-methyltransferase [Chitinophagaceae bacterium]
MIAPYLFSALSEKKGWGIYTSKAIAANTIIESSPIILISIDDKKKLLETILYNYVFDWEHEQAAIGMGFLSIYNHACPSNCEYFQDYKQRIMHIKSIRDIAAHEEITINYQGDYANDKPVWFELLD